MNELLRSLNKAGIISSTEMNLLGTTGVSENKDDEPILEKLTPMPPSKTKEEYENQTKQLIPFINNQKQIDQITQPITKVNIFQSLNQYSFYPHYNSLLWEDLLKCKKVMLFGPANYTLKLERKDFINSFNLVSRVNHCIPVKQNHSKFIGEDTDIYYNNLYNGDGKNYITPHLLYSAKVKCVVGAYPNMGTYVHDIHRFVSKKEGGNLPFRVMPTKIYQMIESSTKTRPNTGILALFDLLTSSIDLLFVSGFTFFESGTTYSNQRGIDQTLHNQSTQKEFIRQLSIFHRKLILDFVIRENLWKQEYIWLKKISYILYRSDNLTNLTNIWTPKIEELPNQQLIKNIIWTWNPTNKPTAYYYHQEKWNLFCQIDLNQFSNIEKLLINISNAKQIIPLWFQQWWFIQHTWMCYVNIPNTSKNYDSYLMVPWVMMNTDEIVENPFEHTLKVKFPPAKLGNRFLLHILAATQQCFWIEKEQEAKQIIEWRNFFP